MVNLAVYLTDGSNHRIVLPSAGRLRLELGIITELPNRWWTVEDIYGRTHSFQVRHIMRISEEA